MRWQMTRLEVLVVLVVVLCLAGILIPAVRNAREAAARLTVKNGLKQSWLAVMNYESAYKKLPPGCDSKAHHGWPIFTLPYAEASVTYSRIDLKESWEHPVNRFLALRVPPGHCVDPANASLYTSEGYGLTHFAANKTLCYRGSQVRLRDVEEQGVWLVTEKVTDFVPFFYPFNWTGMDTVLSHAQQANRNTVCLVRLDGLVEELSTDTDPKVLMAGNLKLGPGDTDVPARVFLAVRETVAWRIPLFDPSGQNRPRTKGMSVSEVVGTDDPAFKTLDYSPREAKPKLVEVLREHADVRTIVYRGQITDDVVNDLEVAREVEVLSVEGGELSAESVSKMASMPSLREVLGFDQIELPSRE